MNAIFSFLSKLKDNNSKEWFTANKLEYEKAKDTFLRIVQNVLIGMNSFENGTADIKPSSCLFRINRDVRFSSDKSPYKTNFGASINVRGKKSPTAGYYIHLEPNNCFVGGGIYMPVPEQLKKIRQEIDYNFDVFQSIINDKKFNKIFPNIFIEDKLVRPPKDYDDKNPAIEYLKLKHFVFMYKFESGFNFEESQFVEKTIDAFKALKPFQDFLNQSIDN